MKDQKNVVETNQERVDKAAKSSNEGGDLSEFTADSSISIAAWQERMDEVMTVCKNLEQNYEENRAEEERVLADENRRNTDALNQKLNLLIKARRSFPCTWIRNRRRWACKRGNIQRIECTVTK